MFRRSSACLGKRIAVVLSGCGVYDGSEIHEATSTLIHLDARGHAYTVFAPEGNQMHVVDHQVGAPTQETRSMMSEAARIARGPVQPLTALKSSDFDALVFPGGFGVMKNLSTFAVDGEKGKVRPDVAKAITDFHAAAKPIGAACIAPVLLAATVRGASITLGSSEGGPQALCRGMGAAVAECPVERAHVDEAHKLVSTPAYMCEVGPSQVFRSIGAMIDSLDKLM